MTGFGTLPKLSWRLSQNSEYWAWSMYRVWRSKRWRYRQTSHVKILVHSPEDAMVTYESSDLHPLLFDGIHVLPLRQGQELTRLVHPQQKVLGQSLPPLVTAGNSTATTSQPVCTHTQKNSGNSQTFFVSVRITSRCGYLVPAASLHHPGFSAVWICNL